MTAAAPFFVEMSPDRTSVLVHYSQLSYDNFGRAENVQHHKIASLFESGRYYALQATKILDDLINRQYGFFLLGIQYTIQPAFWKVKRSMTYPHKISVDVVDIGRTSLTFSLRLINKLDDAEMATALCKMVRVSRSTRIPEPLPDWISQKYTSAIKHRCVLSLPKSVPEVPASAHCYEVTVASSDRDINRHTNQGSIVRFCCDAVQDALEAGALQGFQIDIQRYPLTELTVIYLGESFVGDKLQVLLWQVSDHPGTIHVIIKSSESDSKKSVIFYGCMVYELKPVVFTRL